MLINPCRDDPEAFLIWVVQGEISVVRPKNDDAGVEMGEAVASIHAYGLNRGGLVLERSRLLTKLLTLRAQILMVISFIARNGADADPDAVSILNSLTSSLKRYASPTEPYSAMALSFVRAFEVELGQLL